jgi:ankyrin repeat protein
MGFLDQISGLVGTNAFLTANLKYVGLFAGQTPNESREYLLVVDFEVLNLLFGSVEKFVRELYLNLTITLAPKDASKTPAKLQDVEITKVEMFQQSLSNGGRMVYRPLQVHQPDEASGNNKSNNIEIIGPKIRGNLYKNMDDFPRLAILFTHPSTIAVDQLSLFISADINFRSPMAATRHRAIHTTGREDDIVLSIDKTSTPLCWAAGSDWKNLFEISRADPDQKDSLGRTPLSWAASNGAVTVVKYLLENYWHPDLDKSKVDCFSKDNSNRSPLSWAAEYGQEQIVNLLLGGQNTPHLAALSYNPEIGGRKVCDKDNQDRAALSYAIDSGSNVIFSKIFEHITRWGWDIGKGMEEKDKDEESILSRAAKREEVGMLRILVQHELPAPNDYERSSAVTHLHLAAKEGWLSLAKVLIEGGIPVDKLQDDNELGGQTPLCTAAKYGHTRLVKYLLDKKADPNFKTRGFHDTPLLICIGTKDDRIVETVGVLLDGGANIELQNAGDDTPQLQATRYKMKSVLMLLAQRTEDGQLETAENTPEVPIDHEFEATLVDFILESGTQRLVPSMVSVRDLLYDDSVRLDSKIPFKWIHLPANNVSSQLLKLSP